LCSNYFFNLAWTRPCHCIFMFQWPFKLGLAWTHPCHCIFVFQWQLTWRGRVHGNNGMHGRIHVRLKKVIGTQIYGGMYASTPSLKRHWNTNTQWHGRVDAKLKKSLEHKYIRHGRVRAKLKSHWNIDIQIFVFQWLFTLGVDAYMPLYICVPMTFLTWHGRVYTIVYLCSNDLSN
jgi:hypothetical protein